ncbi:hypothetical protein Ancab_003262 [Ancistrocladus abbreviatus]
MMQPIELIHDIPTADASVSGLWPPSSPPFSSSYSCITTPNPKASVTIVAGSSYAHCSTARAVSSCESPFATPRTSPRNNNSASSSPPHLINLRKLHHRGDVFGAMKPIFKACISCFKPFGKKSTITSSTEDYNESHHIGSTIMSQEEHDRKIEEIIRYCKNSMGKLGNEITYTKVYFICYCSSCCEAYSLHDFFHGEPKQRMASTLKLLLEEMQDWMQRIYMKHIENNGDLP